MTAPTVAPAIPRLLPYRVAEIFGPTIQGEGELIGVPTLFVRFGGCDSRCAWCDSMHAVLPQYREEWAKLTVADVLTRLRGLAPPPCLVTLSGGNPALQPLGPLVDALRVEGYRSAVETQGTRWPEWFERLDYLIVSPKPPSSGEVCDVDTVVRGLQRFDGLRPLVKIVIMDAADLDFAASFVELRPEARVTLSLGNPWPPGLAGGDRERDALALALLERYRWFTGEVLRRQWANVRVLPQLHVLAWGNQRAI